MNWIDEISVKLKKKNQVLFSKNSEYMQDLIMLFETQSIWKNQNAISTTKNIRLSCICERN